MPRPDHYQIPRTKSEYLELSEVDQQRAKRDYKVWKLQGFALIQVSRGLTADCIRPLGELRARLEEEEAKLREPDPSTRFHAGRLAAVRSKLYSLEKSQKLLSQVLSALEMKAGNE